MRSLIGVILWEFTRVLDKKLVSTHPLPEERKPIAFVVGAVSEGRCSDNAAGFAFARHVGWKNSENHFNNFS